jgi:hypothetical protein
MQRAPGIEPHRGESENPMCSGFTAARTLGPGQVVAARLLARPQRHRHERVDVVRQADAMISVGYVRARLLIAHKYR